ncbi:glycosyltransferase family 25 protein [Defluviimonas aestuarii]|uniref:glycosyltransferase family 25 protein n=1 Tax=Albidovulum aestuarii TaxID=1130726 RepID=UPI00249B300C|nr:glycosyltransferase family 25 protein [Defluviimonas aestuarii]MDI3335003.1 glycosyltransferase family 25 protein [Defluviimonas aestuarii]
MDIHVINLARRPDRLASMAAQLGRLGLDWSRGEAIDAGDGHELRPAFGRGMKARAFPATRGDIACSLTHQRLWRQIADGGRPAVVLEDDAVLADSFARLMSCDLAGLMRRHDMGVLKLEFWPGPQKSRRFPVGEVIGPVLETIRLYRLHSSYLGTCGYIITPEGARLMNDRFPRLRVPVDHALFGREASMGFRLLRPGFLNPAPVLHDAGQFGSDIGGERPQDLPRTLTRRLRDWQIRFRLSREIASGRAERVEMQFAGKSGDRAQYGAG